MNTGHGAIDDSQVDALLGDLSNPLNITSQIVPNLKQKRVAFLFYATQHGLDELPGPSLVPPSFEDYLSKKKTYLQQVQESDELAVTTLQTSKLEEQAMLEEEERELREAEEALQKRRQEVAKKKQQAEHALTQKREEGFVKAYKQAFETVQLLDGSLEAMLKEVGEIWGNAFQAVTSIPDVVDQSNLAAEELMKHAERVNQTEMASQFVNSTKRTTLQKLTTNIRLFLDHQASFLQNPTAVSYKGRDQEELSIAARNFCVAQDTLQKTEERLTSTVETLKQIQNTVEQLSQTVREGERSFELLQKEAEESKKAVKEDSFHEEGFSHEEGSSNGLHMELQSLLSSRSEYELGVSGAQSYVNSLQEEKSKQTSAKSVAYARALQIDSEVKKLNPETDSEKISSLKKEREQQSTTYAVTGQALATLGKQIEEALEQQKRSEQLLRELDEKVEHLKKQLQLQSQSSSENHIEQDSKPHVSETSPSRDFESEIQVASKKVEELKAQLVLAQKDQERLVADIQLLEQLMEKEKQEVLKTNTVLRELNAKIVI